MSAKPDKGPKENMYVCVPSPMVEYPSPPEICWHLIAPFTFPGPLYKGSALLLAASGWVIVLGGHCTRNDCALTVTVAKPRRKMGNQYRQVILMAVQPPSSRRGHTKAPACVDQEPSCCVQVYAQRGTPEELAFRVYGRAHVARPQTRRGNSTRPAVRLFAAGQKVM